MQETNLLGAVNETLTEEPISFTIDIAPQNKIHRWLQENRHTAKYFPKKKQYAISPITYGNMRRIARLFRSIGMDGIDKETVNKAGFRILDEHPDAVMTIVAIAIVNSRWMPHKALIKELEYALTSDEIMQVLAIVHKQLNLRSFISTIVLINGLQGLTDESKPDEKS